MVKKSKKIILKSPKKKENTNTPTISSIISDQMSNFRTNISYINNSGLSIGTNNSVKYISNTVKTDREKILDLTKEVSEINKNINLKIDDEIKKIQPRVDEKVSKSVYEKMEAERNNIIGSLSLFVAFFTFISINITIFSKIDNLFTALILMFGMLISISMMLIVFFSFLHEFKFGFGIFVILTIILSILGYNFKEFFLKNPLSPSYEDRIKKIENFEEKIKSLEDENKTLKSNLEQQISKEVQFQLLKQLK